jgi:hypothetical protein
MLWDLVLAFAVARRWPNVAVQEGQLAACAELSGVPVP